ncbi:MAG TPA: FAD-dependent oxidoreductase [Magnetospirillaceae bacterium]|nr:FAD-dependent oxidoreductase [Magnetospirillaceae bacterium]
MAKEKTVERHDVVIIGGGPAGMTAGIYCGRARLDTLLIEKSLMGGLATYTNEMENYPGFPEGSTGIGLMELFHRQMKKFGVKLKMTDVKTVDFSGEWKKVETFRTVFEARAVIIAAGGRPRVTKAPGEDKFLFDKGISFCATCDAAANTGKTVMVIGSGDAAVEEGIFLAKFAARVIVSVIHDTGKMDCNEIAREQALSNPRMEFRWNTMVHSFEGGERLERVVLKNLKTGDLEPVAVDACFEFIGYEPNTEFLGDALPRTRSSHLTTNELMETSVAGVFACGDVREKELRQVATAVGDGAVAGYMAERYIADSETFERQILQKEKIGLIYVYSAVDAPSRELLPMMQEVEREFDGKVKLSVLDLYKGKRLCDRLACEVNPMTVFYTKAGEVVAMSTECARAQVVSRLRALVA